MKKIIILFIFALLFPILNISLAFSLPAFYGGKPANNSYTYGRDSDVFSINITDANLDTSSVVHHIRVNEPGTPFVSSPTSCSSIGSGSWYCFNNSESNFAGLGGDGKNFVFYFDAKNTSGSSNSSENYFVTIDRSAPQIFPVSFSDNSYIFGNFQLSFTISDVYSGVNSSSAQFMWGNSTFNSTFQSFTSPNPFTAYLDTRNFVNNSTYFIYVNVSDNIGNVNTTKFTVYIDNTQPTISIVLPIVNSTLRGITYFQITSTDSFAGLNLNSSSYTLDSSSYSFLCTGTNFSATCSTPLINTAIFSDGFKTINFSISSNSGTSSWNSTTFYLSNNPPSVSIVYPTNGASVRGSVPIVATVSSAGTTINLTQFRWENSSDGNWTNMTCSGTNCTETLDTTTLADGNYTLKINATDNGGLSTLQSIPFDVDNTPPNIIIIKPDVNQVVSGVFLSNLTVTDNFGLPTSSTTYSFTSFSESMNCSQVNNNSQMLSCIGYPNSALSVDGPTRINFTTADLAGNQFTTGVNVTFKNGITSTFTTTSTSFIPLKCGNGVCESNENYCTCPKDCSPPVCKDYQTVNCKTGVPTCVNKTGCGNVICEPGENCSTCEADCGKCSVSNETGIFQIGGSLGSNSVWIIVGAVTIGVGGVLIYLFWPKKLKTAYPGFKPKEPST